MNECLGVCGRLEVCDPVEPDDHPVVRRSRVEVAGRIEESAVVVPAMLEDGPREGDVEPHGVVGGGAADQEVQVHCGLAWKSMCTQSGARSVLRFG